MGGGSKPAQEEGKKEAKESGVRTGRGRPVREGLRPQCPTRLSGCNPECGFPSPRRQFHLLVGWAGP